MTERKILIYFLLSYVLTVTFCFNPTVLKKNLTLLLFVHVLFACTATAQSFDKPVSFIPAGQAAYSNRHVTVCSFVSNQASLAQLKKSSVGLLAERRFMLADLNSYEAVAGIITQSGNFGLKTSYFGFKEYNESQIGLAYARSLGNKFDIGVQFNYNSMNISSGYGKASAISFEIGCIMHLTDKLHAGIHVSNPAGGKFGNGKQENLPREYAMGIGYDASEKVLVSTIFEKEEGEPISINAGFIYKPIPLLQVKAGILSATSSFYVGTGLNIRFFVLDITTAYHPQLGITPGLLLLFNFNKEKQQ